MKRLVLLLFVQSIFFSSVVFSKCAEPGQIVLKSDGEVYLQEKPAFMWKFRISDTYGNDLGMLKGNPLDIRSGIWYTWKNEDGEVVGKVKMRYSIGTFVTSGEVYTCDKKELIGTFEQEFSGSGNGRDVETYIYDASGNEIARIETVKTPIKNAVVMKGNDEIFSIKYGRKGAYQRRRLQIFAEGMDARLVIAVGAFTRHKM